MNSGRLAEITYRWEVSKHGPWSPAWGKDAIQDLLNEIQELKHLLSEERKQTKHYIGIARAVARMAEREREEGPGPMITAKDECPDCEHRAYHHQALSCGMEISRRFPPEYCACSRAWNGSAWLVMEKNAR